MSNILNKILILVFSVIYLLTLEKSYAEPAKKQNNIKNIPSRPLGEDTFSNIKQGKMIAACSDAKRLGKIFLKVNEELVHDVSTNDKLLDDNKSIISYSTSSFAKQQLADFKENFLSFLVKEYKKDAVKMDYVYKKVNTDIVDNIMFTSFLVTEGVITEKEFDQHILITYCGLTPPASYISPKDMAKEIVNPELLKGKNK